MTAISPLPVHRKPRWLKPIAWLLAGGLVLAGAVFLRSYMSGSDAPRQLDDLVRTLEAEVQKNPQDVQARLSVAAAYLERGLGDSASAQFQAALDLEPDNLTALIGLGRSQRANGDPVAARASLEHVIELTKDDPISGTSDELQTVYFELGTMALEAGDPAQAVTRLEEALRINSADADAWYVLGKAQQAAGDTEAAETAYLRAVALVPDFVEVYESLKTLYEGTGQTGRRLYAEGVIDLAKEDFGGAREKLELARSAEPEFAVIHEALGMTLEALGDTKGALDSYEAALHADPTLLISGLAVERLSSGQ